MHINLVAVLENVLLETLLKCKVLLSNTGVHMNQ
jgi:hypothetical protein